jgi:hypothetical protein
MPLNKPLIQLIFIAKKRCPTRQFAALQGRYAREKIFSQRDDYGTKSDIIPRNTVRFIIAIIQTGLLGT